MAVALSATLLLTQRSLRVLLLLATKVWRRKSPSRKEVLELDTQERFMHWSCTQLADPIQLLALLMVPCAHLE